MKVRAGGLAALAAVGVIEATAGSAGAKQTACGTVTINEQAWAGSTANTYVAKNVLEKSLGCKVNVTKIAASPSTRRWPTARRTRSSRTGVTRRSGRST